MSSWTYMNIKGQGHSLTLVQGHSDSTYSNIFKRLFFRNRYAKWSQISCGACMNLENESLFEYGPGHMTNMAVMPIYGKNLKKSSILCNLKSRWPWNLVCRLGHWSLFQMMTLGWPWPILRQGQIWSPMLLYWRKVKQWIFLKLL